MLFVSLRAKRSNLKTSTLYQRFYRYDIMRTEDGYIIQQCLNGNSAAFGLLVDKYKKSIYALAYSEVHNFHDAQDIAQEVFIRAYEKLRTLKRWDNFVGWLYRITTNLCKNWLRSASRRPDREFVEDQDPNFLDQPSVDSYREDMVYSSVRAALDSLPAAYRQVLTLRHFGGMNVGEIARFLGISPRTIDRRLREARIQLKEEILATMNIPYEQHELPASFMFNIIETIKRAKIQPAPRTAGLPWGLSLTAGIIITVLSAGLHLSAPKPMDLPMSPLHDKMKVLEIGEISVDILKASQISIVASEQANGGSSGFEQPNPQNASLMAPQREGGKWAKKAGMPIVRANHGAAAVNGKIYAIGGSTPILPGRHSTIVEEYDPVTDMWTSKSDMPTARMNLSSSTVNGKIYAIGGYCWQEGANGKLEGVHLASVEEYDPATDTWTSKSDMPAARNGLFTTVLDGKIYAIGGIRNGVVFPIVEVYDPAMDTWTKEPDMPAPRNETSACTVNGKIYVIGGQLANGNCGTSEPIAYPAEGRGSSGKRTSHVVVNGAVIKLGFLDSPEFATCFPGGDYEPGDEGGKNAYCGAFIIRQDRRTDEGSATFWFHALGDDGKTDIKYRLEMDAAISSTGGDFPLGNHTVELTSFVLSHESGGKKRARPCEQDFSQDNPEPKATVIITQP